MGAARGQARGLATKLRKAWIDDQKSRFKSQTKGNKNHPNVKVAGAYGTDAMLELAQMAEVQAIQYKKIPANAADPAGPRRLAHEARRLRTSRDLRLFNGRLHAGRSVLRDSPKGTDAEKAALEANKKKFGDYIKAAESGLAKLPAYKGGAVVRCTKSLWQNTIDAITRTGEHVEKSFMSAGKKQVAGFGDIVWEIDQVTTGKDISLFSLHQTEGEVLFPPNSKFRFFSAEVIGDDGQKATFNDHGNSAPSFRQPPNSPKSGGCRRKPRSRGLRQLLASWHNNDAAYAALGASKDAPASFPIFSRHASFASHSCGMSFAVQSASQLARDGANAVGVVAQVDRGEHGVAEILGIHTDQEVPLPAYARRSPTSELRLAFYL